MRRLPLRAGMRILDLGCGKATSSIFQAREFGVEVWAADGATSPSENRKRAVALGCEASVFPLRVDAHSLPFAKDFFDTVIAIDSFVYFGTDDRYLSYLVQFIKPGGFIGVVDILWQASADIDPSRRYALRDVHRRRWPAGHRFRGLLPPLPDGYGAPVVVSCRVCRSASPLISAPNSTTNTDSHIQVSRTSGVPNEP